MALVLTVLILVLVLVLILAQDTDQSRVILAILAVMGHDGINVLYIQ